MAQIRMTRLLHSAICMAILTAASLWGQKTIILTLPHIVKTDSRYALFVDGAPYLMLGAQINNSSAWPAMLSKVWPAIANLHANTVEMPVYWEQLEPVPGHFDYSVVDTLLAQAREHHVHLILLWFGTWKNGSLHYTPAWIKLDNERYPRVVNSSGRNMDSLSANAPATLDADRAAFVMLMRHLKAADPQHTVLMIQVENEVGTYGSIRDYGPAAQKLFSGFVPEQLLKYMHKQSGTWQQVFGDNAESYFQAWTIASYVEKIAAAGKAVYPVPMYVNAALRDPLHPGPLGTYDNGGPTDDVLPIWKAAAPSIDIIGPDIYMSDFTRYEKVLDLYHRPDNPMFVPETGNSPDYARYFFAALGHQAIGFSPFGVDYTRPAPLSIDASDQNTPLATIYELISPMDREIAQLNFDGKLQAVAEDGGVHQESLNFGDWRAVVSFGEPQFGSVRVAAGNSPPIGGALVAQLKPNEFLVTALHAHVDFAVSNRSSGKQRQFVRVEEGKYKDGQWRFIRIWNGDQTDYGLNFTSIPQVLRVRLATF